MAPAGRPKAFDQTQALEAAMGVFWAKGYDAACIAELVEAMGIGRQSLYDTFGDKRSLFLRCLQNYTEEASRPVFEILASDRPPAERLGALFEHWQQTHTCPKGLGCLSTNTLAQADRDDPEVAAILGETHARLAEILTATLDEAQAEGSMPASPQSGDLAALLLTLNHGLSITGRCLTNSTAVPAAIRAIRGLLGS